MQTCTISREQFQTLEKGIETGKFEDANLDLGHLAYGNIELRIQ